MAQEQTPTHVKRVCLAGLVVGLTLTLGGGAWSTFGSGREVYSLEEAKEYEAAAGAMHAATIPHDPKHGGAEGQGGKEPPPLAEARERFARAKAALDNARFAQDKLGPWLVGIGLAATTVFGIGYWTARG